MDLYFRICYTVLATVLGLCVGSFLNVVVYRLPRGIKMTNDRSHCPKCGSTIKWYDNIPLLSYIFLLGKCRNCKEPISPRYPIVEALNALGWAGAFLLFYDTPIYAAIICIVFSCLICVCLIDIAEMIIFDRFNIIIALCGVASIFCYKPVGYISHIIGGIAAALSLWLIGFTVSKIKGVEALGMGDVKFSGACGLLLGWEKLVLAFLAASLSACVYCLIKKKKGDEEFPFGPFLAAGFALSLYFGEYIISAYLGLFV